MIGRQGISCLVQLLVSKVAFGIIKDWGRKAVFARARQSETGCTCTTKIRLASLGYEGE